MTITGAWVDPECVCVWGGGGRGSGHPWNCQIINFCHVEIFRQTPSGNLDPPEKIFWIRACGEWDINTFAIYEGLDGV